MAISVKSGTLKEQKEDLKAKLAAIEKQEKDHDEKCMILVGRAISEEAESDPIFAARMIEILDNRLTKKRERLLFSLPEKSTTQP